MFDLFRRRDTNMRYVLMVLLSLIAISMVVTLIPGFGTGGMQDDQTIAQIGDRTITVREASARVEQSLRSMNMPRQAGFTIASTTIDNLIAQRSSEYLAERMGFHVSNEELVNAVKMILPQAFPNGQFVGSDTYAAMLAQRGIAVADFESRLRSQLLVSKIGNLIEEGTVISPAEIEAEYKRQNEQIKIEFVALRRSDIAKEVKVTDADIRAEYEKNKAIYTIPEKRSAAIFYVDEAKTGASVQPSDADLRRAYNEQSDRFRTPERVKIRHILLKTTGKPESEVPKMQAKAEDLLKKVKAGGNFAELARVNSEDTISAQQGGDLGFITKGQTVKPFEDAAWKLKPNEISDVIKTEYGFHILQLTERQDARLQPFDEVKAELANEAKRQVVFDRMQRNIESLRSDLSKSSDNFEQKAQQYGATLVRVDGLTPQTNIPQLGASAELAADVAMMKKGEVTSVVQIQDKLAVALVTEIEPSRPAAFEEVAANIRQGITDRRVQELLRDRANELTTKARAPGADLKKLGVQYKAAYKTTPAFNRNGAAEGLGSASLLSDAFGKSKGYVPNPIGMNEDMFVARVTEVIPADLTQLAQNRDSVIGQIRQQRARERGELFQEGLVQKLTKDGKVKINQENLQRLLNSYRQS